MLVEIPLSLEHWERDEVCWISFSLFGPLESTSARKSRSVMAQVAPNARPFCWVKRQDVSGMAGREGGKAGFVSRLVSVGTLLAACS